MKQRVFVTLFLLLPICAVAKTELVTVLDAAPVYNPDTYTESCFWNYALQKDVCELIARPDKPFPLPMGFDVTVKRMNGEVVTFRSEYRYTVGSKVNVDVDPAEK